MSDKLERTVKEYRNKILNDPQLVRSHPYRNAQRSLEETTKGEEL